MSNQIYDNYDSFAKKFQDIIKFQEITIMSSIDVYNISNDYSKNIYLNLEDKGYKISKLKIYKNEFNCSIDVANDFGYAISKMEKNTTVKSEEKLLIETIVESITNGDFIDVNLFKNSCLSNIAYAYNNFLSSYENNSNSNNSLNYSEIIMSLKEFREKAKILESENSELNSNYKSLCEENNRLSSENAKLNKAQEEIFEIVKKIR